MEFLKHCSEQWLRETPEVWEMPAFCEYGERAIMYSGLNGKRNFAWIGLPKNASPSHPVPGIVLVHGGGGTAFANWVDIWTKRGYAAIAMDTCGQLPDLRNQYDNWTRHSYAGPMGWGAFGEQAALPPEEQWFTHADAAIIKATTILSNLPEVDSNRIGMTGISWGSCLAIQAATLDPRIKAAAIVYGCGFCTEDSKWMPEFAAMTPDQRAWWANEWDAASFVPALNKPTQWIAGTNDAAYRTASWQKTIARLADPHPDLCMKIRWPHGHGPEGELPREIDAFMREQLCHGKPRIRLEEMTFSNGKMQACCRGGKPITATLICTVDNSVSQWWAREWITLSAEIHGDQIAADLPKGTLAASLSVLSDDLLVSTSQLFVAPKNI